MSHRDPVSGSAAGFRRSGAARKPAPSPPWPSPAKQAVRGPVSSGSGAHAVRPTDPFEFRFRRLRMRARLGSGRPDRSDRRSDPRDRRAIAMFSSSSAAAWIPRSPTRCACARWGRIACHGTYVDTGLMREGETEFVREQFRGARRRVVRGGGCGRAISWRACGRHRSRGEAPHHRRGVRRSAGADSRRRAFSGRPLDSRPGHDLSRHHRIRRHRRKPT